VGYNKFKIDHLSAIQKDQPIIVYCSVGYRSEKITKRLIEKGYTQVYNLVGSIFEWTNKGLPLENSKDEIVKVIHTYNKKWSKWVDHPDVKEVW